MAKTLNHYSQQIRSLAPDAVALDRAKVLGDLLIDAKAAVKAAGKLWTDWLQSDCDLTPRTAGRFMTIAKRWNEDAFTQARNANPSLAIREADKVLAASSTRKRINPGAVKQLPLSAKLWQRSSLTDDVIHYCPVCSETVKGKREQTFYCGGKTHNFSSHPKAQTEPHDPVQMICSCQGGFDGEPHFMVLPKDLSSYGVLAAVVSLAKQIHAVMKQPLRHHATWFEISSGGHTVNVSNAVDPDQFPGISLSLDDNHQPCVAWVGSALTGEAIKATPTGIVETDELRSTPECERTYKLLKQALGWGQVQDDNPASQEEYIKEMLAERAFLKANREEIRERGKAWADAGYPQGEAAEEWKKQIGPASWE